MPKNVMADEILEDPDIDATGEDVEAIIYY